MNLYPTDCVASREAGGKLLVAVEVDLPDDIDPRRLSSYIPTHPWGRASRAHLNMLVTPLVLLCNTVADHVNTSIVSSARSLEEQRGLVRAGRSKTLDSKHVVTDEHPLSRAVDIQPYPCPDVTTDAGFEDFRRFSFFVMGVGKGLGLDIRCGVDWDGDLDVDDQTFHDLYHFEVRE